MKLLARFQPLALALGPALVFAVAIAAPQNVALYAAPSTFPDLDPSSGFSNENVVMANVYETLTFYAADGRVQPKLASDWQVVDDLTWTFTLRDDVTFHDGTALTAQAVKASLERTIELGLGAAFILDPIESIEASGDHEVTFHLGYPAPLDLILSSGYGAWIMSPNVLGQSNDWFNAGNDGGSGPYTIDSYAPGESLVLKAFDEYWGGWSDDGFGTVVYQIVEEPTLREQMIRSGEADFTYNLPYTSYPSLANRGAVEVSSMPSFQALYGLLNTRKPPLDDHLVRRALLHSFPYRVVVDNLYGGMGKRAAGAVPQGVFGALADTDIEYDIAEAERLLAESGVDTNGLELVYTYAAGDLEEQLVGELWRAELARLGIDLELRGLTWEAQWDLAQSDPANAQDIFVMYWWPTYVTPYDYLFNMFHSEEEPFFNLGYYSNPEFDRLIDEASAMSGTERERASELYRQAQELLNQDAAAVFMIEVPDVHVIDAEISGYENNPGYPHVVFWHELRR
jgi:peptide/nickel transport system substrate-binding protein